MWPRVGWWAGLVLVLALQFIFIFALGRRTEKPPRQRMPAPPLQLRATESGELLALRDPTLFILPHRESFSGHAWLQVPSLAVQPYAWTEPQQWLGLQQEKLGTVFNEFMGTNDFAPTHLEMFPRPPLTEPNVPQPMPLTTRSTLRVTGDLAGRAVVSQPELPALPGTDVLANSIVQVLVDASGNVLSVVLFTPGSGSTDADSRALELAKSVRFAALPQKDLRSSATVTVGTIVFGWQTVPVTNPSQ
ncbi:MAG TPA: energy transducer TonB [Verrucomicrobiae bacterium]|nr:energy transducer TonB [Verrucomicrobiae bacterium]